MRAHAIIPNSKILFDISSCEIMKLNIHCNTGNIIMVKSAIGYEVAKVTAYQLQLSVELPYSLATFAAVPLFRGYCHYRHS